MDAVMGESQAVAPPRVNSFMIGGTRFDLPDAYTPVRYINQGAYGVVCSGVKKSTGQGVAIKKITNAFDNLQDTKRILREIKLLQHFDHPNLISLIDLLRPPSKGEFNDIYMISELMDTDFQQVIGSDQVLSDKHIRYFLYQILCGLNHVHSANVLHRDLKPSNILCNEDCRVKIADFGLARVEEEALHMTEYVATRWYRAPEVILSWKEYTKAIDIWSVGCILAEMMLRKPLFQGTDYVHQIISITDILGTPPLEDIRVLGSEQAQSFLLNMGRKPKVPWSHILPGGNELAFDLLDKMLVINPAKRYTVEQCLAHPYLAEMRVPAHERQAAKVFDFQFENWKVSKEVYQELLFQEVLNFHPEAAAYERATGHQPQQPQQQVAGPAAGSGIGDMDLDSFMEDA
mmetsp:Transcript_18204/g.70371  ORF Transcript_18204/g.70371 Transcript_18204/m.70371 type:complete len:403 (+) Transcript_18204:134-1342(+)